MKNITINLWLRPATGDQHKIYLRLTIDRKSKIYSTGVGCFPENWDPNKQRILRRDKEADRKNDLIEQKYKKAKDIIYNWNRAESPGTFLNFECEYLNKGNHKTSLLSEFIKTYIADKTGIFEPTTIKRYNNCLVKLVNFAPDLKINDLNYEFCQRFEAYLRIKLKNQHNTITKEIKILKTVFNEAQRRGLISQDKKLNYQINYKDVIKDYLSIEELKVLADLIDKDISPHIKRVLFYFVFSCFTGLRISDIARLRISDFKEGFRFLDIVTQKTKDRLLLPLSKPAQGLITKYMDYEKERFENALPGLLFFNSFTEQYGRRVLKDACGLAGINKQIGFHTARYTFATICNTLGVPIEVTSRLLSHKTLRMTLKYAKFSDNLLSENINKWNKEFTSRNKTLP